MNTSLKYIRHFKRLRDELSPILAQTAPLAEWRITLAPGRSRKCTLYRVSHKGSNTQYLLKCFRNRVVSPAAALTQYNGLLFAAGMPPLPAGASGMHIVEKASDSARDVPAARPVAYLPALQGILMQWVEAPSFQRALLKHAAPKHDLLSAAAHWLGGFHSLSEGKIETINTHAPLTLLHQRLDTITKLPAPIITAREHLTDLARSPMQCLHAKLHGDFTPSNLLISPGGPIGIDMWAQRTAPVVEDMARMLVYLGMQDVDTALQKADQDSFTAMCHIFEAAYGPTGAYDKNALKFYLIYQTLRRWCVMQQWFSSRQNPFKAHRYRQRLESILNSLCQEQA